MSASTTLSVSWRWSCSRRVCESESERTRARAMLQWSVGACSGALDAQLVRAARPGREALPRVRGQLAALPHRARPVAVRQGARACPLLSSADTST